MCTICLFLLTVIAQAQQISSGNQGVKLALDHWTYIEVDNFRGKWGDFAQPNWLKYLGLDAADINNDGYLDIISGRYFYRNPGGNMTAKWERIDLGINVDGMLFVDVDGDELGDIIATALPDVYWFEAQDKQGSSWKGIKIGEVPATSHVNGQGIAWHKSYRVVSPKLFYRQGPESIFSKFQLNRHLETGRPYRQQRRHRNRAWLWVILTVTD